MAGVRNPSTCYTQHSAMQRRGLQFQYFIAYFFQVSVKMNSRMILVFTVVAVLMGSATVQPAPSPNVPWEVAVRAVIATADLKLTNKALSSASGTATLIIPRLDKSKTIVANVTLKGALTNITMAHIHLKNATAGNPIVMFLQPRLNYSAKPALLDPPVSFKGTYSFISTYDMDNIINITPGWTLNTFMDMLRTGLLYVNVHTTSQPAGAVQGALDCPNMCLWPLCSLPSGLPC
ncbi:hypothetical protein VaNZ11_007686 [Volvox africanus]|uniref:CHRD domain-containing protein n=1 Tax=Volvox africanus TaxID=51714 RepID=A0ABQ5S3J9_9CHLO|nr:hypothetical protein VaNZ11_007686 [Volvox africanus]